MRYKVIVLLVASVSAAAMGQETGHRVGMRDNAGDYSVYSNNNVNLGNLDSIGNSVEDGGTKLQGPNVCTKQEP